MRKRAKSLAVDMSESENYESNNDASSDKESSRSESESDVDSEDKSESGITWSPEETMKMIRNIYQQLPSGDKLPYKKRLNKINWKEVADGKYSVQEVKKKLTNVILEQRNYRLLSELLKDVEELTWKKLSSPRKPVPAFILFIEENKDYLKSRFNKNTNKKSYTHEAAEIFKTLPEVEKERYKEQANNLKKEYKNFMDKYNLESKIEKSKKRNKVATSLKQTPLSHFVQQKAKEGIKLSMSEGRKEYTGLDKSEKLQYILSFLDVEKGEKLSIHQCALAKETLTKDELALLDEYEGKPKKLTAYNYFMKDQLATKQKANSSWPEMFKNAVELWKNLPAEEKQHYEEMAKKSKSNYQKEHFKYIKSLPPERQIEEMEKEIDKKEKSFIRKNRESVQFKMPQKNKKRQRKKDDDVESSTNESENDIKKVKKEVFDEISDKDEEETLTQNKKPLSTSNAQNIETQQSLDTSTSSTITKSLSLKKPPSSTFKYYVMKIYNGPKEDAKKTYKSLSSKEKNKIEQKYEKAKRKFLEKFEEFVQTLSPEEIVQFEQQLQRDADEGDISDLTTDSESDSD